MIKVVTKDEFRKRLSASAKAKIQGRLKGRLSADTADLVESFVSDEAFICEGGLDCIPFGEETTERKLRSIVKTVFKSGQSDAEKWLEHLIDREETVAV